MRSSKTPDFNPNIQKHPITLDDATIKTFGHFAGVVIDIDLNGTFHDQILVERKSYGFFVGIEYEKLPPICPFLPEYCPS